MQRTCIPNAVVAPESQQQSTTLHDLSTMLTQRPQDFRLTMAEVRYCAREDMSQALLCSIEKEGTESIDSISITINQHVTHG